MSTLQAQSAPVVRAADGTEMVRIEAGPFWRGSTISEILWLYKKYPGIDLAIFIGELGYRRVYLPEFFIDVLPVTNALYKRFLADDGYRRQEFWSAEGWKWLKERNIKSPRFLSWDGWNDDHRPIVGISWFEADAFARWSGKRLPTEAEWEKAARGCDGRRFPWGNAFELGRCNSADYWVGREISDYMDWATNVLAKRPWRVDVLTTQVGSFPTGASPYGLRDVAGNVWEWTADWFLHDWYRRDDSRGRFGPTAGVERVCRGGSFGYYGWSVRAADRGHHRPQWRSLGIGMRCALDAT